MCLDYAKVNGPKVNGAHNSTISNEPVKQTLAQKIIVLIDSNGKFLDAEKLCPESPVDDAHLYIQRKKFLVTSRRNRRSFFFIPEPMTFNGPVLKLQ